MSEARLIPHGSTVEVRCDQVVITHPHLPTVRVPRRAGEAVTYGPITTAGQWLKLTSRPRLSECMAVKVDAATRAHLEVTAERLGVSTAKLIRAFIARGLEQAEAARNA